MLLTVALMLVAFLIWDRLSDFLKDKRSEKQKHYQYLSEKGSASDKKLIWNDMRDDCEPGYLKM